MNYKINKNCAINAVWQMFIYYQNEVVAHFYKYHGKELIKL